MVCKWWSRWWKVTDSVIAMTIKFIQKINVASKSMKQSILKYDTFSTVGRLVFFFYHVHKT